MAEGKTMWEGITGIIKLILFGVPALIMLFFILIMPEAFFNNFGVFFVIFIVLTIVWWVIVGMLVSKSMKARQQRKYDREIELAKAKGRAFRGEDD